VLNKRRVTGQSSKVARPSMLLLLVLAAVGCAAQTPTPRDARAAGEWTFRLPETQSPYAGLAIAHGSGNEALAAVDDALADTPNARVAPQPAKPKLATKRTVVANAAPAAPAPQPVAVETAATPVEPQPLALHTPTTSEEQLYAQRESQSQKQREFRGGDAIVISASAIVVILLVVLLVLLLT